MHQHVGMCTQVKVSVVARGTGFSQRAKVPGSCELSDVGVGD